MVFLLRAERDGTESGESASNGLHCLAMSFQTQTILRQMVIAEQKCPCHLVDLMNPPWGRCFWKEKDLKQTLPTLGNFSASVAVGLKCATQFFQKIFVDVAEKFL
jgi:hypothetical protein